jgi:hypothetical protein
MLLVVAMKHLEAKLIALTFEFDAFRMVGNIEFIPISLNC